MSSSKSAISRIFSQPAFVVAFIILAIGAVCLNTAVEAMQLHFKKQPVPLTQKLEMLPAHLGSWVQVSKDEPLGHDVQEVLGTDVYVFRDYVNERIVGKAVIDQFKDKSATERKQIMAQIQMRNPEAVVNLGLTYYTGLVDTVAHIPDRCIIADGYEVKPGIGTDPKWPIRGSEAEPLEVRYLNFEDQAGRNRVDRSVAYFFNCNGDYTASTIGVRTRLQDLTQRYGYYAKVECMTLMKDEKASEQVMIDFLSSALPEIEKLLPDWNQYSGKSVK
jgi:hypothetical protein